MERDSSGFYFSDKPDAPPPIDYSQLITIVDDAKLNAVGDGFYSLSKGWYDKRGYGDPSIRSLRNGLKKFFQGLSGSRADTRMWTCFKNDISKLVDSKTGRFRKNFIQTGARATNRYKNRTDVAYMVNRFADPNILKFFRSRGIDIDQEAYALSEMLQWVWRSAIRDNKPITVYIPSKRMRTLLIEWIKDTNGGDSDV